MYGRSGLGSPHMPKKKKDKQTTQISCTPLDKRSRLAGLGQAGLGLSVGRMSLNDKLPEMLQVDGAVALAKLDEFFYGAWLATMICRFCLFLILPLGVVFAAWQKKADMRLKHEVMVKEDRRRYQQIASSAFISDASLQ